MRVPLFRFVFSQKRRRLSEVGAVFKPCVEQPPFQVRRQARSGAESNETMLADSSSLSDLGDRRDVAQV